MSTGMVICSRCLRCTQFWNDKTPVVIVSAKRHENDPWPQIEEVAAETGAQS